MIDARDYGCTESGDNVAAWGASIEAAIADKVRCVLWPEGKFRFDSQPASLKGVSVCGVNQGYTTFIRNYSGHFAVVNGGSSALKSLCIEAGAGTSQGNAVQFYADNTKHPDGRDVCPDYSVIEDVVITHSGGTWNWPLVIDGSARTIGARNVCVRNVNIFAGVLGGVWLGKAVGARFFGGGVFPAGGAPAGANVYAVNGTVVSGFYGFHVSGTVYGPDAGNVVSV